MNRIWKSSLPTTLSLALATGSLVGQEEPSAPVEPTANVSAPVAPIAPEAPALNLDAIGGEKKPVLKTTTSPSFNTEGGQPDLSKMEGKRIDIPELKKIPESELPELLRPKNAKAKVDEPGMLGGLLKRDKVEEPTEPTAVAPSTPAPVAAKPAVSTEMNEAVEKVKTAETQADSFTAALALAVGGEQNLPAAPASPAIPMEGEAEFQPLTGLPEAAANGVESTGKKIGGFFSGMLKRDEKSAIAEPTLPALPVAEPTIALPVGMNGPPEPVIAQPVAPVTTAEPVEPVAIVEEEKGGFLSGIGNMLKRERDVAEIPAPETPVASPVTTAVPVEEVETEKKRGVLSGMFSSDKAEKKAKTVTDEAEEKSESFLGGLLGGKKGKAEKEATEKVEKAKSEKKFRMPTLFKSKKEKVAAVE